MSVVVKPVDDLFDVLVDERVIGDVFGPAFELSRRWELAIQQQVSDFEISALLRQLVYRITAILEYSLVAIDERDATLARRRVHERRVVRHQTKIVVRDFDLTQIHGLDRAVLNW